MFLYISFSNIVRRVRGAAGQVAEGAGVLPQAGAQRGAAAGAAAQHLPGAARGAPADALQPDQA